MGVLRNKMAPSVVLWWGLGCFMSTWSAIFAATSFQNPPWRIHTLFSVECDSYFDWQTVGLMNSYRKSGHPGLITRLLSCTEDKLKIYKGMDLAPTHVVPSMSLHPVTHDWYPAINKPVGVLHWLNHSEDAKNVDWIVILDADMIIRKPIVPWELGAEKGRPVAAYYGYLIGCDNLLAKLHTKHPELCDKVGGLLVFHVDDIKRLAPLWLSKTEEVRQDRSHWSTNLTGDIYGQGWISEMYGYSFGAAEAGLRHKINDDLMIYPGYVPRDGTDPLLLHYGLKFAVGNWSFNKADHHNDDIVYECNHLFPHPPYPKEVQVMEPDFNKKRGLLLSIECVNTINEGLMIHHERHGCPKPPKSKYLSFLKSRTFLALTTPKIKNNGTEDALMGTKQNADIEEQSMPRPKIHTVFSTECSHYFDWQTVGFIHSFALSGQPGPVTRLLSCTDEKLKSYTGHDLAPTHYVPSMSNHPLTGDWYPAINKAAAVLHWLNHAPIDADYVVILDADMILRGPITPWEFGAERGHPVSAPYGYLIGCDNELAQIHTRHPEACDKVGGVIIMHIEDLRTFAPLWLHKTEEVRADKAHWATNITGDIYGQGWISEMYGYAFGAAELNLRHRIRDDIMIYPGYIPMRGAEPRVLHYGLGFSVGTWKFDKADWRETDMTNVCWRKFPDPPDPSSLVPKDNDQMRKDKLSIECVRTLNEALYIHHKRRSCPSPLQQQLVDKRPEEPKNLAVSTGDNQNNERGLKDDQPLKKTVSSVNEIHIKDTEILKLVSEISKNLSSTEGNVSQQGANRSLGSQDVGKLVSISPRYWMVPLWMFFVLGFLIVLWTFFSRQRSVMHRKKASHKRHTSFRSRTNDSDEDFCSFLEKRHNAFTHVDKP